MSTTLPVVQAFLAAMADPSRGADVYDAYAPDALVMVNFQAMPVSALGREPFARLFEASWAMYAIHHGDAPRRPAFAGVRSLEAHSAGDGRCLAWFEADPVEGGAPSTLAVGLVDVDGAWRIDWLTLTGQVEPWSYARGRAACLADFEYSAANMDVVPRSWLDLAHYRLHGHARPALAMLPDARFSCGLSGTCCTIDHRIELDATAQAFIDAVPWEELAPALVGTQLPVLEDGRLALKANGEACRFLDANRHCLVHKAFGRPVFRPCTVFPYRFTPTPDGVAVATSPLCGSARRNMGAPIATASRDVHARLAITGIAAEAPEDTFRLTMATAVDWPTFQAEEARLLAALGRTELALARRLWLGARRLQSRVTPEAATDADWLNEPMTGLTAEDLPLVTGLVGLFEGELAAPVDPGATAAPDADADAWVTHMLRNMFFSKAYSFAVSLVAAHNMGVLTYAVIRRLRERSDAPLSEGAIRTLCQRVFHGELPGLLARGGAYAEAVALLDRPELGLAVLAWLESESPAPVAP